MSTIAGIGGERYWVHVPRQNSRPRAYKNGGLVAAAAAVKGSPLANKYGDTELVHVNKYEMEKLREMWGEPGINPETGLPAYGWFGKLLGGIAKIAGSVLLTPVLGPVGAAAAVSAVSGVVEGKSIGDIAKGAALSAVTAGAGQVAGQVLPGAIGIGKDVAQAVGSGLGSTAGYLAQGANLEDALMGGVASGFGTYSTNKIFDTVVDKNILGLGDAAKFVYGAGQDIAGGIGINDSISGIGKNIFGGGTKYIDGDFGGVDYGNGDIVVTAPKLNLPSDVNLYSPGIGSISPIRTPTPQPVQQEPVSENENDIVVVGQPDYGDLITVIGAPGGINLPTTEPVTTEQIKEDVDLPPAIEVIGNPVRDNVTIYPGGGGIGGGATGGGGGGGGGVSDNVTIYPDNGGGISSGTSSAPLTPIGGTYETGPRTDIYGTRGLANITFDPFTYGQGISQQPGEFLFFTQDGKPYGIVADYAPPAAAAEAPVAMKDGGDAEADDEGGLDMVKHLVAWQKGGGHQGAGQVKGIGSGQEDKIPAWLSDGEYVWSAQDVADLGDGSTDEGVRRLDKMRQMVRRRAGRKDVKKIAKPQQGIDTMLKAVGGPV